MMDETIPKIFAEKTRLTLFGTINHTDNYHSPSNITFQSPNSIKELETIHFIIEHNGKSITPFGGQDVKITETHGENGYTVDSHERRLNDPLTKVFTKKTSGQIIKWICEEKKVKVGKFAKTSKKHPKLAFENKKAIDICHQVATLEDNMIFTVNVDGLAELKKIPSQEKGYVFNLANVTDYELSYDYSDIKTGVKVYGKDNKLLYSYNDKSMSAKYGVINEIISDDSLTTKSSAKAKGTAVFKEKKNPLFAGAITIPGILPDLHSGTWCSFGIKDKYHNFWIGTVVTTLSNSDINQKLTLYDGKPAPPSDWIYNPPNESKTTNGTGSAKAVKGVPQTVADKANELGELRKCWEWVKNKKNIDYEFYYCDNKIKGPAKTLSSRGGNCFDKNTLFKYMARQLGYKAHVECHHKCGKYDHCICYVWINGQKWLVDTACKSGSFRRA